MENFSENKNNENNYFNQFISKVKEEKFYKSSQPLVQQLNKIEEMPVQLVTITPQFMILGYGIGFVGAFDLSSSSNNGLNQLWSVETGSL